MMSMMNMMMSMVGGGGMGGMCGGFGGGKGGGKGGKVEGSGTAEVRYDDPNCAAQAIAMLNGSSLDGNVIQVSASPASNDGSKLVVTGLSSKTQWQEVKDHFKTVGVVAFCDIKPAGMGGMGGGCGGCGGMMGMGASADVESFLSENGIDDRAGNALRELPPMLQMAVMSRGGLQGASNASSALMVRIKNAQQGGWSSPY
jgi:RNA recognition motif-containing protein